MSKSLKNYDDPSELLEHLRSRRAPGLSDQFSGAARRDPPLPERRRSAKSPGPSCSPSGMHTPSSPPMPTPTASRSPIWREHRRPEHRPELDRWVLSVLQSLVADVNTRWRATTSTTSSRRCLAFVDDLTNWYVRRSRRRFLAAPGRRRRRQTRRLCHALRSPDDLRLGGGTRAPVYLRAHLSRSGRLDRPTSSRPQRPPRSTTPSPNPR